jgi:hypothetical protein
MSPELKKLLENFDLDRYADCENLTFADWYTQLSFREIVGTYSLSFQEAIPELLRCPLRPEGLYTRLAKEPSEIKSGIEEISRNFSERELSLSNLQRTHSLSPVRFKSIQQAVFLNLDATDDQIVTEVKQYLKNKRSEIGKFFPEKNRESWIEYKILAYIDICLLAMSIEASFTENSDQQSPLLKMENVHNHITYQEIAYLLFKDEIDSNPKLLDGQRIRLTCKSITQKIIQPYYLSMLRHHALDRKESHFIKGHDSIWVTYSEFEEQYRKAIPLSKFATHCKLPIFNVDNLIRELETNLQEIQTLSVEKYPLKNKFIKTKMMRNEN